MYRPFTKLNMLSLLSFAFLTLYLTSVRIVSSELFTAQVELQSLFSTQQNLIEAIEVYMAKEEIRLMEIKKRLVPYIERARKDPQDVVANPISAFLLVKALSVDLDDLLSLADSKLDTQELSHKVSSMKSKFRFPNSEDLNGAAVALTRLQDTYHLDASDIARGDIKGHCCAAKLNTDDLFELGRQNYNQGDYDHTIVWMNEALIRLQEDQANKSKNAYVHPTQADILEYLAFSTYQKGEIRNAISLTEQLLRLEPNHPRASGNIGHYEKMLQNQRGDDGSLTDQTFSIRVKREEKVGWEKSKYEALCRGEGEIQFWTRNNAKCRYARGSSHYLLIGPVKEELVHLDPDIIIYHDVLFDHEIATIKNLAQPRFKRATVHNHATGALEVAHYRISKSAWLQNDDDATIDKVNKRVHEITGLELGTAEELQVVNYGLGGHYEPHFDFARRDEQDAFKGLGTGNRIATFLFYMTDVEEGGATVFPTLELSLWPVKGAAAFWYNLFEDGHGDTATRHAGCPVLLGTKWVSNKWIHERGQEFIRPCKLHPTPTEYIKE